MRSRPISARWAGSSRTFRLGSSRGTIQLGILLLIATPVARVLLLVLGFAWQRDRTYVLVSLVVLGLLVYSLFGTS